MVNSMKKGFTLIELVSVIVIIAFILFYNKIRCEYEKRYTRFLNHTPNHYHLLHNNSV